MGGRLPYKVLLLTRYSRLGASSRVRFLQFLPALRTQGFEFDIRPFFNDRYITDLYGNGIVSVTSVAAAYWRRLGTLLRRKRYDLIWLEKEALPWLPAWIESPLMKSVPYVVDFDDAWFHRYDQQRSTFLRSTLGGKIDVIMRQASIVVAGNDYLADRARQAGAAHIAIIPSTIDLDRYPSGPALMPVKREAANRSVVIGWIGTPLTAPYLTSIEPALRAVATYAPVLLRVIGAQVPAAFDGLPTDAVNWSEATEVAQILDLDVGIMPLADTPWEQGKCAYKLLQIMAAGRPVVASPVGANRTVVQHGVNGLLANSTEEWIAALRTLILAPELRHRLGAAARNTIESQYSMQRVLPSLASVLKEAIGGANRKN